MDRSEILEEIDPEWRERYRGDVDLAWEFLLSVRARGDRARQDGAMNIEVKRLESGYYHIRGEGPCNWAQPPHWPCDERVLRKHAFPEASEQFISEALQARG